MPLVGIGTLPTPFQPASVPLPPETGGRGHTSLRMGGWGESQFRRGAYTVVLFICTYFVVVTHEYLQEFKEALKCRLLIRIASFFSGLRSICGSFPCGRCPGWAPKENDTGTGPQSILNRGKCNQIYVLYKVLSIRTKFGNNTVSIDRSALMVNHRCCGSPRKILRHPLTVVQHHTQRRCKLFKRSHNRRFVIL